MNTLSPKSLERIPIDSATASTIVLLPAVAGKQVVLAGGWLVCDAANDVTFQDSDGNQLAGPSGFGANGGFVLPVCELGYLASATGKGLSIVLASNVQTSGCLSAFYC